MVQVTAGEVLRFLANNPQYGRIVVHGFSIGAYVWGEVQVQMSADFERYSPIVTRVKGQVYDSIVDTPSIHKGFPLSVFPNNYVMRTAFEKYLG